MENGHFIAADERAAILYLWENSPNWTADENGRINIYISGLTPQNKTLLLCLVWFCQCEDVFLNIALSCDDTQWKDLESSCPEIADTSSAPDKNEIFYCVFRCNEKPKGYLQISVDPSCCERTADGMIKPDTEAEETAQRIFRLWSGGKGNIRESASDYHTSMMSAVFWLARKRCGKSLEITEQNMRLEHRRWNAYMRSLGYVTGKKRDNNTKTHPCLVGYDDLSDADKLLDANPIRAVLEA